MMHSKNYHVAMARQGFDVDEVLDAVFDSNFGLSEGESYLGDPVVGRAPISNLADSLIINA
jgi:hypothetical protein